MLWPRYEPSIWMREALARCQKFAVVNRPVVFVGPVGAGKTTMARRLHELSGRAGPMVPVTAGETSESMFRDSLFGHVKGAFTGASAHRAGAIEQAGGGTLLLDDIAHLAPEAQAAILRALEERVYYPIGSDHERRVECRLVFASTVPMARLVESGALLPDFRSRLGEFVIEVPGLARRRDEIPALARHFASDFRVEHLHSPEVDFTAQAIECLKDYNWPTNVRELQHVVERAVALAGLDADLPVVEHFHFPDHVLLYEPDGESKVDLNGSIVMWALEEADGIQTRAAAALRVHRNTIRRWKDKLGLPGRRPGPGGTRGDGRDDRDG